MVADRANYAIEMATTLKSQRELLDIPLQLDPGAGNQSLQVNRALRNAILDGRLAPGLRLPSSRALARQLGLRRNAIIAAYEHLSSDGFVETRTGAGTYVAATLPRRSPTPGIHLPDQAGDKFPYQMTGSGQRQNKTQRKVDPRELARPVRTSDLRANYSSEIRN